MTSTDARRPNNVLLAYDGSQHSQAAVQLLCDLPLPPGSRVTTIGVFTPQQISNHVQLQAALDQANARLTERGFQSSAELLLGYPAEKVIEFANDLNPDLILLGAKGLRATMGILLGGVAQQVVEYANWPVLVVRAPYHGLRKILLVTDGSSCGQRAVSFLGMFALPQQSEVRILYVLPPNNTDELLAQSWPVGAEMLTSLPPYQPVELVELQREEECLGEELLAEAEQALKSCGIQAKTVMLRGDAATEMIDYVKQNSIDLVVAGSRGLTRVQSWLLGSVSRKLIHYAGTSVLVVKGLPCQAG